MNNTQRDKFQLIAFGKNNPEFEYEDYELALKLLRLASRHQKLAEMDCNGYGTINGQTYYNGPIDARQEFGHLVKSAYINENKDETIFDIESERVVDQAKKTINHNMVKSLKDRPNEPLSSNFRIETQGDTRGCTMKVFYKDTLLNNIL